ncbi:helix-turn-helix domain-containing protein [Vagococcus entomophilus]|uniref:PucR C-terminal helix-turn-helix domain-containing protein n=1 Tax=Vagococcus entomophilus TaxID=1160095 RepID=A0A430AGH2_9ENTE|nr:helix-turn-helix domain-containing protein [Vagococcus entomophilus]RSU06988.1 hypothetical protein CBF30_06925 [Vagococcus entomophilus]
MTFQELLGIYPAAVLLTENDAKEQELLYVKVTEGFAGIRKAALTQNEQKLLKLLTQINKAKTGLEEHEWYPILFENQKLSIPSTVRIIQVRLNYHHDFLKKEWIQAIKEFFSSYLDVFFLNETEAIIVEEKDKKSATLTEIEGFFQALDGDFSYETQFFLGSFWKEPSEVYPCFQNERTLFSHVCRTSKKSKGFTLGEVVLKGSFMEDLRRKRLFQTLYQQWFTPDMNQLLESLWRQQGNISSVSKELFLHRNTVVYRMERFQEHTFLNLKCMDDVFLCHFLIQLFG